MTTNELKAFLENERMAPVLPLIAAAWEDGSPTDLQIAAICLEILLEHWPELTCKGALARWFSASEPPSPTQLAALRAHAASLSASA